MNSTRALRETSAAYADRPVLRVERVGVAFDGRAILRDVSFDVQPREFVMLLGRSGAGKTSLLRCVAGLSRTAQGTIVLGGTDVATLRCRERRRIAVVFQQFNLVQRLSALDNVLAGRLGYVSAWRGVMRRFDRSDELHALECLDRVGLLEYASRRVSTLSGGQQQRVAIARALVQRPELIIADEPVASLDPSSGAAVLGLLRKLCREEGVAVLCSLHQVRLAREFGDRIVGLADGRVMLDVTAGAFDEAQAQQLYAQAPAA